jgi:hypothetical protein
MAARFQVKIIPGVQNFVAPTARLPTLRICNITVCSTALLALLNEPGHWYAARKAHNLQWQI